MKNSNIEKIADLEITIAKLYIELAHCKKKEAKLIEVQLQAALINKSKLQSI